MQKTEMFMSALQTAGENGVKTAELQNMLGGNLQTVHTTAYFLRKQGVKLLNKHGLYFLKGVKSLPCFAVSEPTNLSVPTVRITDSMFTNMDPASKLDLIEQLRRAKLHSDIALAIVNSYKFSTSIKEKI